MKESSKRRDELTVSRQRQTRIKTAARKIVLSTESVSSLERCELARSILSLTVAPAKRPAHYSESALLIRGRQWSCEPDLGSRKVLLLPKHVLRLKFNTNWGLGQIGSEMYVPISLQIIT